ncbi:uncharacterized protein ATC70_005052 [Mucor velutinosus]|uniref:Protein SQS1 n=1 Tax=Mucor velutinosus TaxID=708070 RepID=A0AAN7HX21_9FUNG|nr:hypothetical protein ATC70_005052 [Mucor velutinosus]
MPGRGKRGNGRGRGRGGAGARGRGRGRISIGGGGRGRNRELIPSAIGYVYRPRSNVDEFDDDFRIYGQFGSDQDDSESEFSPHAKKGNGSQKQHKKNKLGFFRESRPSFGSNYDDNYDDAMDRAGLGASSSSSQQNAAVNSNQQFAKGKSKYLKTVLFTKSSSSIDLTKEAENVVIEQEAIVSEQQQTVQESMSNLSLEDATVDEKLLAKKELWGMLKGKNPATNVTVETFDYAEFTAAVPDTPSHGTKNKVDEATDSSDQEDINLSSEDEDKQDQVEDTSDDEIDLGTSSDEQDFAQSLSSEDEEDYQELYDTEEDELLEDDMLVMEDYLEHIELDDEEDLNELLAWSAMQEGNCEVDLEDDLYDYATLDQPSTREIPIMEEEEAKFTSKKGKRATAVDEDTRKKVGHRTRDDNSVVDPEIFGRTLKAALADVPPGLRPGMRRWYEKQQRKEDKKKKREEAKAHRKEKKKNGKGRANEIEDPDFTNQMAKIDERMRDFVQDDSISSFQFAPMATNVRRQLHVLAAVYNLKSKSTGGGGSRCTIVTKTPTTCIPNDRRYISRYLLDIQTNMDEQNRIIGKNRSKGGPPHQKGKKKFINSSKKNNSSGTSTPKQKRGDGQFPAGPSHGTVVAFDAAPIGESNVGHRMLAAMGWKQGEALGSKSEGIVAPIEAIIRKKGRGLGS